MIISNINSINNNINNNNYKINNNNKDDHYSNRLINLPHILLKKIISELDDIDRFCFSLVCKRWYAGRDKYLIFGCSNLYKSVTTVDELKNFHMNSYKSQVKQSLDNKMNCNLFIGIDTPTIKKNLKSFDYSYDFFQIQNEEFIIPKDVVHVIFSNMFNSDIKILHRALEHSNVKTLSLGCTFDQPLKLGSFTSKIETLYLLGNYNQMLEHDSFPQSLKHLVLGNTQPFKKGVLPDSLRILEIGNHRITSDIFPCGSLPPNLHTLNFHGFYTSGYLEKVTLPPSLTRIKNLPIDWLTDDRLTTLSPLTSSSVASSLRELTISSGFNILPVAALKPGDIPSYLTKLDFGNLTITLSSNMIPPSVTSLYLGKCKYSLETPGLFSMETKYQVLHMGVNYDRPILSGQLPPHIHKLVLPFEYDHEIGVGAIPFGVVSLDMGSCANAIVEPGVIPSSVTKLKSQFESGALRPQSLPNSITSLNVFDYFDHFEIPPSVRILSISMDYLKSYYTSFPNSVKVIKARLTAFSTQKAVLRRLSDDNNNNIDNNINNRLSYNNSSIDNKFIMEVMEFGFSIVNRSFFNSQK